MATKDRTVEFTKYRREYKSRRIDQTPQPTQPGDGKPTDVKIDVKEGAAAAALPPDWVDLSEGISTDLQNIKAKLTLLGKAHTERLRPTFNDEEEKAAEMKIDILTQQITQLMKKGEGSVKRISSVGDTTNLTQQEKTVRLNVMRNLGSQLHDLSKQFRGMQKEYILKVQGQEGLDEKKGGEGFSIADGVESGRISDDHLQQLAQIRMQSGQRTEKIMKVVQSVQQLAQVFKELDMLVIEQGTVLDRIDYNIEQAKASVGQATKIIVEEEKKSRSMRSIKCMVLLVVVVFVMLMFVIAKHNSSSSSN